MNWSEVGGWRVKIWGSKESGRGKMEKGGGGGTKYEAVLLLEAQVAGR